VRICVETQYFASLRDTDIITSVGMSWCLRTKKSSYS